MDTPSSPSQSRKGAASGSRSSTTCTTKPRRSKRVAERVQAQHGHKDAYAMDGEALSDTHESSDQEGHFSTDNDHMDACTKPQHREHELSSSPTHDGCESVDQSISSTTANHDIDSNVTKRPDNNTRQAEDDEDEDDDEGVPRASSGFNALMDIFGGQSSSRSQMFGLHFGHISSVGSASQLRSLVSALKRNDDPVTLLMTLQELVELLAMSTEESFIGVDISELVRLLGGALRNHDATGSMTMSTVNGNPDSMLLACRCLSNLLEALPLSGSIMCRHNVIEALCEKLFEIEYIDLAEQALSTLEHLSVSFPDKICEAGGMSACLMFLDFFPTSVQKSALTCAVNCAKAITGDLFPQAKDSLQVLERTMFSDEQSIASLSCTALLYLVNAFHSSSDKIEELVSESLLKRMIENADCGGTSFTTATHTTHLRILAIVLHSSSTRAIQALDLDLVIVLKRILTQECALSEKTSGIIPLHGQLSTNTSERVWYALHLMSVMLPQLPTSQQSFIDAEKIIAQNPNNCGEQPYAPGDQLHLLFATVTRPAVMERLQELLIPLVIRVFTNTADAVIRYKLLQTTLKVFFIMDANGLRSALENVNLASFIANTLSAAESPVLIGTAMLIVRIVLSKLPGVYDAEFGRVGIIVSLERIKLDAKTMLEQEKLSGTSRLSSNSIDTVSETDSNDLPPSEPIAWTGAKTEEQKVDLHSLVSGFKMVCIPSSATTRSTLAARLQQLTSTPGSRQTMFSNKLHSLLEWTLMQTQDLLDALAESNSSAQYTGDQSILTRLEGISKRLDPVNVSQETVVSCVEEVSKLITSDSGITCYELTRSRIVETLSRCSSALVTKSNDDKASRAALDTIVLQLFSYRAQSVSSQSLQSTAFAILVQRLQETMCLTEQLQVTDVYKSEADYAKPLIHMLTKHLRFLVSPSSLSSIRNAEQTTEKDLNAKMDETAMARIRRSLDPATIGVHAVSLFSAIEAYLRPRVALCIGVKRNALQAPGTSREDCNLVCSTDNSASLRTMHPHESSLENHTANFPSDTGSDEQSSEGSQTDSALDSDHLRLLQMIARSSGIDLRSVGLFDSLDTQDSDDESNSDSSSHIDNTSSEDLGNTTLDRSRDLDREQSTSIPDSLGSTSESSGVSDGESKSDWRLVMMLKVGSSKRVVDASESIFGVLHKMYQSDPSLREADFWSTTYELEFYVEFGDGPQPTDDQQCTQRLGHAENKDRVSAMDGRDQDPSDNFGELGDESVGVVTLLGALYRMYWQACMHMPFAWKASSKSSEDMAAQPDVLASWCKREDTEAVNKLFVNSNLDSKLRQQLGVPLVVVCSALPQWCYNLTRNGLHLLSFDTRLMYLRATSFGYTRSISYWQDLSRREARRNRRVYSEAQIPLGRIQRQKVRISRTRMLESAFKVLEMYGSAKTVLEIEYFDEAGIGNGPTLEFYSLVSRCLQERALGIWRDGSQGSETATTEPVQYVDAPLGLFPRACGATKAPKQSNKQMRDSHYEAASPSDRFVNMFQFIGHFVAKGLVDNRILDLPLHEEFWAAVHRHSKATVAKANGSSACWTWGQLESLDPQFADSLWYLQQFVDAKNKIYARKDFTMEQQQRKVSGIRDSKTQARVEDLALDFTLPGNPTIELRPGGADIPVTINNVHTYIDLVAQWTLYTGVCTQVAAFCEGFNRIFPVSNLSIFTPAELCKIFGPSKSSEDWTATTISSTIELGDGYSLTSPPVKMMIDLLESFSVAERREFLLFSTGSPRLPIGGFQALSPPLKLVLKNSESPLIPDDYLPSVMTCSNLIKLPAYSSFEILKKRWNQAVSEGCHSFHLS